MAAVGVKELRGRMRGRRAFVILTLYLLLVAGFAWMVESITERSFACGFTSSFSASAEIGRAMFFAIIILLTLVTLILAPASTAGAISLEREKQTLDLLTTTPISSLAIVLGKLFSALSWIFLLLLASIPIVALVFTFGGVAPGGRAQGLCGPGGDCPAFGSIGLFVSALVKRTQAATVINLVIVIALTAGTAFVFVFWVAMTGSSGFLPDQTTRLGREAGPLDSLTRRPPEALMWLNPFVAQMDVVCGTETGFGGILPGDRRGDEPGRRVRGQRPGPGVRRAPGHVLAAQPRGDDGRRPRADRPLRPARVADAALAPPRAAPPTPDCAG